MHHVVTATFPDILPCAVRSAVGTLDCRKKCRYIGLMDKALRPMATPRRKLCGGASIVSPMESDVLGPCHLDGRAIHPARVRPENLGSNASVETPAATKGSFSVVNT
jgi:hypothetical protein